MSLTAPEQPPVEGQDPQTTPPAPPAPPAPVATPGSAPWAADLNSVFTDEVTRGQVDQFLREKVQPYTTKLEQQAAQVNDGATKLWKALEDDPVNTYVAITTEMYGEAAGQAVLQTINQQLANQTPAEQQQTVQTVQQQAVQLDPRLEAALTYIEADQHTKQYDAELARITNDPANADIDAALLHPFIGAAEGDFDQAVVLYRNWYAQFYAKYYGEPATPEPDPAPPVMGSDTGAAQSSATPAIPQKQTLDEAINDLAADMRAAREAPPVTG